MTKVTVYNNFVVALNFTCESVSLRGVSEMAENIRFRTKGYRLTWEEFRDGVPLPFIVHWKQRHIFVGYDIIKIHPRLLWRKPQMFISDQAQVLLSYSKEELLNCWINT